MSDRPSQENLERCIAETSAKFPEADRSLCNRFLERILGDMHISDSAPLYRDDSDRLAGLFNFFRRPIDSGLEEVKVWVEAQRAACRETPGDACVQEGTSIIIHLPDTPFILESLRNYLKQSGLTLYARFHTTFSVRRDDKGALRDIRVSDAGSTDRNWKREMVVVFLTEVMAEEGLLDKLRADLVAVLTSVKRSVEDFDTMVQRLDGEADRLEKMGHAEEARFLRWTTDDNFVFMGMSSVLPDGDGLRVNDDDPPMGVLRGEDANTLLDRVMPGMRGEINQILLTDFRAPVDAGADSSVLLVEYCQHGQSMIYASEGVDFFTIRRLSRPDGENRPPTIAEQLLVLGRFSRTALASRASTIPVLAVRMQKTMALSGHTAGSYLHHEFRSLYDRMPLRELFYSSSEAITAQIQEILNMQGDTDVRISARLGRHGNYVSILIALSRNRFRPTLDERVAEMLSEHLPFPVSSTNVSTTGTLSFIVCFANHDPGQPLTLDIERVREPLNRLVMTWEDKLRESLLESLPQREAHERYARYVNAFESIYRQATLPSQAALDIEILESLGPAGGFSSRITRHVSGRTYIKRFDTEAADLTHIAQTFHNLGLTCLHELSSIVKRREGAPIIIQRFEVECSACDSGQLVRQGERLLAALAELRSGWLRDDALNRLVLLQGFSPKEVSLIRSLRQYLLQISPELSWTQVNRVLIAHHHMARLILDSFRHRFAVDLEPSKSRERALKQKIETGLAEVVSLQDDQILRMFFNLVEACLRTNYFKHDRPEAFSFKVDCAHVHKMASPRPWRTIFVHGPHMEGIHLRGGKVSRGGLRFSDRMEDFRTEVLGLMKTQMVKNAIIVPVGAKGGFVVPRIEEVPFEKRKEWVSEQYKTFIRAMLDITDNRIEDRIVHPDRCVIHDEPDPYLVVAADKGTATFSDLANHIAEKEYRFWLGDAFASGGSNGYDHKKVGITARGAWECIRLHFEEMGHDIDIQPFTVVGIGDMSGDVFGNGLLASRQIRLVGAFNHRHIFLDPDPDPELSYRERERLFKLPRSSWTDYDTGLISKGGGVFERTAKAIPLNGPLHEMLDSRADSLSGEEVIKHLLRAKVDLLYNGGIGTYIKARGESNLSVSDKANDAVRVNASEVRARIVGEGGNLGITQKGRLEIARSTKHRDSGHINTDAVDNSGGVDMSDHEVNLKILFNHLMEIGEIKTTRERNELLARLTEEVADAVLRDNRVQHQAISRDQGLSVRDPETYLNGLEILREKAGLDFKAEDIPEIKVLKEWVKEGRGLPRPLLAIMLGYAKLLLYRQLLQSDVVDMHFFESHLLDYFPSSVSRTFEPHLSGHFLKREIIATSMTNRVLNQTGAGLLLGAYQEIRRLRVDLAPLPLLIKSYFIVEHLLDAAHFRKQLDELGTRITSAVKYQALEEMEKVLLHLAVWMLTHLDGDRISIDLVNLYGKVIRSFRAELWDSLPELLSGGQRNRLEKQRQRLQETGLPMGLATDIVILPFFRDIMTILHIKESLHTRFQSVAHLYIQVDDYFGLSWIEEHLQKTVSHETWERMNLENIRKELLETRTLLVKAIITFKRHNETVSDAFRNYLQEVTDDELEYQSMLGELRKLERPTPLPLSVLVRKLREILLHGNQGEY